jgi:hypothetical protein
MTVWACLGVYVVILMLVGFGWHLLCRHNRREED